MARIFSANRIFIKLLLGFWLCSSLIIALVALLPLLQQNYDRAPLPAKLEQVLARSAKQLQDNAAAHPEKLLRWQGHRHGGNKHMRLFLTDEEGRLLNGRRNSRTMRHFMLMAEEAGHPISHQFRDDLMFGPYQFAINGNHYALWGRLPARHPRPWFLFLADNIMLTLGLAIALSGLICALLAWHLGKPLRQLKQSADALANGELGCRVNEQTCRRGDEIGQLANAFNAMADAIEQTMHSQQRLISDVSHELRTPLTRLQLALALARKQGLEGKELSRIGYEAEQLELLISELLELSRVKNRDLDKMKVYELAETLSQVLDDAEFEAEQQHKQLTIILPEDLCLPHHPRSLSRAIENLLRNAIRYADSHIRLSAVQQGKHINIVIEDDGPGIDASELEAIFRPFYRPHTARERESGGWGLGLAITQAAVTAHRGTISAANRPQGGLMIRISLPC
ncbi:two-component sensor histidine kinase [Shewanella sp. NFH-SH190041]|uniref:ATP-binding protein n=1 Tax=Shewanella sp. NFH-SH190041 TaxID=2950245 RepID=UPI0021C3C705|nr:ATP-binding protein [Shewanella sp. NFH-SH190041]BDM65947.1 two-component sensor histidine kinase [Shewanella sp. NFH-SH190041]